MGKEDRLRIVNMVNLRYDVKVSQIEDFFKDFSIIKGSVVIAMNNGMPTGRYGINQQFQLW